MSRKHLFTFALLSIIFVSLLIAQPGFAAPATAPIEESDPAETILQLVNEWRIQEGLWPLRQNNSLQTMAQAQAEYIKPRIETITDEIDFHKDSRGRLPPERAKQDYQWPLTSSASAAPAPRIGENAAVGSPKYAMNFWKSSDIHRRAALSNIYHEVGVGVVPYKTGYIFIMDFGSRPDSIAVLTSLRGDRIYLANDCLCGGRGEILNTKIRIFNDKGVPLIDTIDWKPVLGLDAVWGSRLTVLYTNGSKQLLVNVEVGKDIAILPRNAAVAVPVVPTNTPTPIPLPVLLQPSSTPAPAATNAIRATVAPTIAPTTTPIAKPATLPDLILFYNTDTLILFNNNKRSIDLTGLALGSSSSRISVTSWKAVANFPDTFFPTANCLQAGTGATTIKNDCKFVRSSVYLAGNKIFWLAGIFKVTQNDEVIGECDAALKRCEVWMKFALPAGQSTSGKQ